MPVVLEGKVVRAMLDVGLVAAFVELEYEDDAQGECQVEPALLFVDEERCHQVVVYDEHDEVGREDSPGACHLVPAERQAGVVGHPEHHAEDGCECEENPDGEVHQVLLEVFLVSFFLNLFQLFLKILFRLFFKPDISIYLYSI